jgi:enoyl-CoA hydratase/carnithine racemase
VAAHTFETILYDVEDGIATITLNRPDRLNAFTGQMMVDMIAAFDAIDADDEVRAVIVTGAGRGFCAGADLAAGGDTFDRTGPQDPSRESGRVGDVLRDGGGRLTLRIFDCLKPVIAAVNGPAVGVGVTMQLPMDIRLASTDARFGFVFARRGLNPEAASSWFLPHLVGPQTALEWCFTAASFRLRRRRRRGWCARCPGPRDRRQPRPRLHRHHPPADLAHDRRRAPDGGAHGRQPRHPAARRPAGRARRGQLVPGEARAAVPGQGLQRPARHLAAMERADLPLIGGSETAG